MSRMTEEQFLAGIKTIPTRLDEWSNLVQDLGLAGVELAIEQQDGRLLGNLYKIMPEKFRPSLVEWITCEHSPFIEKKGVFTFCRAQNGKGRTILEKFCKVKTVPDKDTGFTESELIELCKHTTAFLEGRSWLSLQRAASKAARVEKTDEEKRESARKALEKATKTAKELGLDVVTPEAGTIPSALAPVLAKMPDSLKKTALDERRQARLAELVESLPEGFWDTDDSQTGVILLAIAKMITGMMTKQAA